MARIRTIKPEFPHSESMGRVSRDARLLFVQLWTICDDSGRARGNSRMLASLLFPYDDDAPNLLEAWMVELEREGCLVRYKVDGQSYVEVQKWQKHQKIDKPSPSRLPGFEKVIEDSAKPREASSEDLVPRTVVPGPSTKTQASPVTPLASRSPLDFRKELWSRGVHFLKSQGLSDSDARSMLGKWRKTHGDLEVLNALAAAEGAAASEAIPYISAVLSGKVKPNGRNQGQHGASDHPLGIFGQLADELRGVPGKSGREFDA